MTEMRDVRLKKALDSAPDGDVRPGDAVREAILNKARISAAAVSYKPPRSRWWSFSRPWNSGLATVGLVAFVGVLIWGQGLLTQPQKPLSEAMPAPATQQASSANAPAVLAEKKEAATDQARGAAMERRRVESAQKSVARETAVEVSIAPEPAPPAISDPVPQIAMPAPVRAPSPAMVSTPAPAMMSPPPPPVMSMAPPPGPTVMSRSSAIAPPTWTTLRVRTPEGPVLLQRESLPPATQALLLQQQLSAGRERLAAAASSTNNSLADQKADKPALFMQIELLEGERSVSYFDIGQGDLRKAIEQAVAAARKASAPTSP